MIKFAENIRPPFYMGAIFILDEKVDFSFCPHIEKTGIMPAIFFMRSERDLNPQPPA